MTWVNQQPRWKYSRWDQWEKPRWSYNRWNGGQQASSQSAVSPIVSVGKSKEGGGAAEDPALLRGRLAELRKLRAAASEQDMLDMLDLKIAATKQRMDEQKPVSERLKLAQERVEASKDRVARNHDHVARAQLSLVEAQNNEAASQQELAMLLKESASQEGASRSGGEPQSSTGMLATLQQLAEMLSAIATSASGSHGVVTLSAEELLKMGQIVNASQGQLAGSGAEAPVAPPAVLSSQETDPYMIAQGPPAAYHTIASSDDGMELGDSAAEDGEQSFSAVTSPHARKKQAKLVRSTKSK